MLREVHGQVLARMFCGAMVILATTVGWAGNCQSQPTEFAQPYQIQWAGVSFVGDMHRVTPVTSELWQDPTFQKSLTDRLKGALKKISDSRSDLEVVTDRPLEQGEDTYVLSFAIAGENVESQQIDDTLLIAYELQALVLVANMSKDREHQRIVTSYPVRVRFVDTQAGEPSAAQKKTTFRQLFLSPQNGMPDIIAEWGARAVTLKMGEREKNKWLHVAPLKFAEPARAVLQADARTLEAIALRATSTLEAGLSKQLDIPIIPSSFSEETKNTMCLKLPNVDDCQTFVLARAAYRLAVRVNQVREVSASTVSERGSVQKGYAYGATMLVQMLKVPADDTAAQEVLFGTLLKRVDTVVFGGERKLSPIHQFSQVITNFHYELASNLCKQDGEWLSQSKSDKEKRSSDEIKEGVLSFCSKLQ